MAVPHLTPACQHSELAIGWALHALEPAEQSLVAPHLEDCPECVRTVAETEQIGAALGLALSELVVPSPGLQSRVLAATAIPQVRPVTRSPPPAPHIDSTETESHPATPAISTPWRTPDQVRRRQRLCVPDMVKLMLVALLALAVAAMIVFYAVP